MFDHVTLRAADRDASERFYRTLLGALGIEPSHASAELIEWNDFPTQRLHVAFPAPDRQTVDDFHRAAVAAGYRDNGGGDPWRVKMPQFARIADHFPSR